MKRVEKSPKAKQYYTTTLVLFALLSIDFAFFLYSFYLSPAVFYHIYSTHLISSQRSSLLDSFIRFTLQRLHFLTTLLLSLFPSTNCPIFITHSHHSQSVLSPLYIFSHSFFLFIIVIICYICAFVLCSYLKLGDLSTTLEMTVLYCVLTHASI